MPRNTLIYNADGASRASDDERQASFGVVLTVNNVIRARFGKVIGDETNNVAEYLAAITALRNASFLHCPRVIIRLDSLLVVNQLLGIWACRSSNLRSLYEEGLSLMTAIENDADILHFTLEHVYREFNADADSTANEALDAPVAQRMSNGIAILEHWDAPLLDDRTWQDLRALDPQSEPTQPAYSSARDDNDQHSTTESSDVENDDDEGDAFMNFQLSRWD